MPGPKTERYGQLLRRSTRAVSCSHGSLSAALADRGCDASPLGPTVPSKLSSSGEPRLDKGMPHTILSASPFPSTGRPFGACARQGSSWLLGPLGRWVDVLQRVRAHQMRWTPYEGSGRALHVWNRLGPRGDQTTAVMACTSRLLPSRSLPTPITDPSRQAHPRTYVTQPLLLSAAPSFLSSSPTPSFGRSISFRSLARLLAAHKNT